jgi:hypothetical protein
MRPAGFLGVLSATWIHGYTNIVVPDLACQRSLLPPTRISDPKHLPLLNLAFLKAIGYG